MDLTHLTDKELLEALNGLLVSPSFPFLIEFLRRRQAVQIKRVCSLGDPIEIYRSQGQVKAYDSLLNLPREIKALK